MTRALSSPYWLAFPLAALLLLWPALIGGQAMLPAEALPAFSPWREALGMDPERLPQWNVLQWDGLAQFYPWRLELARELGAGRIPLWNPYVLCGTPFLANSQSAPLYPLHSLLALPFGSVEAKMAWLAFLHLTLAGILACLLARHHGARPAAAVTAGVAYQLSGFAVAWLELPSFITVACWIPLVLLSLSRALREPSAFRACAAGGAIGLMLLGGHLQIAFYGLLAAGCCWVWEVTSLLRGAERRAVTVTRLVAVGAGALTLGLALSAAQLLPSVELSRVSHRAAAPTEAGYAGYLGLAMPPQNWITLLAPDYYGLPGRGDFWGFWRYFAPNTVEYAGHVGAAGFVFMLVGLRHVSRSRGAGLWVLLGAAALLLAAGAPLNRLLYFYVPGFAQSGSPARSLVLFCLAQAMLAGVGVEALLRRAEAGWTKPVAPLWIAGAAGVGLMAALHFYSRQVVGELPNLPQIVGALFQSSPAELTDRVSGPALARAAGFAAAPALLWTLFSWLLRENAAKLRSRVLGWASAGAVGGILLWTGGPYNPTAPPALVYPAVPLSDALEAAEGRTATINREWELVTYAAAVLPPNASLAYGWRDAQGYDSLALGAYRRLAAAVAGPGDDAAPPANGNMVFIKDPTSPLLPLMGVRRVVTREPFSSPGLRLASGFPQGPPYVYEVSEALPDAYAVSRWVVAEDAAAAERLRADGRTLAVVAVGEPVRETHTERLDPAPAAPARVNRMSSGRIRVSVEPELPSLVVLTEALAPGWKVRVQERGRQAREARILRTNIGFQGVLVASGPVTLEWTYAPASFRAGLFLSLVALMGIAGGVCAGWERRARWRATGEGMEEQPIAP